MATTDTLLAPLLSFHWYWWPHWSEDSSCVWDSPPPWRTLPFPSHHARRDKGLPDVKSCRPKVWAEEERRRKEEKWRKFKLWSPSPEGKLACHLCRLSSHSHHPWKRERGERQQGRGSQGWREGGKDGGKEGEADWEHETGRSGFEIEDKINGQGKMRKKS